MDDTRQGQTLVEMALVLPILGLAVAVTVQLIVFCHNQIALQLMAAKAARQISVEAPRVPPALKRGRLWGNSSSLSVTQSRQSLQPWGPFKGIVSTIKSPGSLAVVRAGSQLLPRLGFGSVLPKVSQQATAETFIEPPRPPED